MLSRLRCRRMCNGQLQKSASVSAIIGFIVAAGQSSCFLVRVLSMSPPVDSSLQEKVREQTAEQLKVTLR